MSQTLDMDAAERERDKRIRRRMLFVLHEARSSPKNGLHARLLCDVLRRSMAHGQSITDDGHAMGLIRDLVNAGYVTETRLERRRGQEHGIDTMFVQITAKGSQLWLEQIPPDPLVDDNREVD